MAKLECKCQVHAEGAQGNYPNADHSQVKEADVLGFSFIFHQCSIDMSEGL